ncbi:monocarboxylate transporter 3-like [Oratosquilla oratoria]|uniref:monocarboxylate transporter 3-like n=1 Tax=Oratosquilla oratoria TaxID=337810 RepID=UPI003F764E79
MNSLHKHIPGLKRHDAKTSTIRQHYYPEGGWGWLVCACVFVVHALTTGLQFSFGVVYTDLVALAGDDRAMDASWVGCTSLAVSHATAPLVVALCRRKSTRLTAVIGGLVMALAILFASFAVQLHQVFLSYGLVLGIGVGMTRETANLMIGQYFKRRREFVEIIVQSGSGIGITLFSVFFKEVIKSVGWRLGLQAVTGVVFVAFFLGIFYRSASLYHPQRRAILHLKNQRRKQVKDKTKLDDKPPYFDIACLKSRSVQVLLLTAAITSIGLYTPIFFLILDAQREGLEDSSLILLQTFLGFAYALGCIGFGLIVVRQSDQCLISRQYLCQASFFGIGVTMLALTAVRGYYGYVLFMWLYGLLLGGGHYAFKMLTLEKVRAKHFSRAWGFIQGVTAIPILFGVPITGYISASISKRGYFFASFFTLAGSLFPFLLNFYKKQLSKHDTSVSFTTVDSHLSQDAFNVPLENGKGSGGAGVGGVAGGPLQPGPVCTCGADDGSLPPPALPRDDCGGSLPYHHQDLPYSKMGKTISFATSVDVMEPKIKPELLTCVSDEGLLDHYYDYVDDCVAGCNKLDHFFTFGDCETQIEGEDDEDEVDRPPRSHRHILQNRLQQAQGVSFSDPEGLARLGQSGAGCSGYARTEMLSHPASRPQRCHTLKYRGPTGPQPPILRRATTGKPRRNITVIEEMTTSV